MRTYDALYVDGRWTPPESDEREVIVNPATEEPVGHAPVGGKADVVAALGAARRAFDDGSWSALPQSGRCDAMLRLYDGLAARHDELVDLLIAETGAPRSLAVVAHVGLPMDHFAWALDAARRRPATTSLETIRTSGPMGAATLDTGVTVREPVGVVGAITAYNYPF